MASALVVGFIATVVASYIGALLALVTYHHFPNMNQVPDGYEGG